MLRLPEVKAPGEKDAKEVGVGNAAEVNASSPGSREVTKPSFNLDTAERLIVVSADHLQDAPLIASSLRRGSTRPPFLRPLRGCNEGTGRRHGFIECPPFAGYMPDPNSVFMTLGLHKRP